MNIEDGWMFSTADFSVQASGKNEDGMVRFIRDPKHRAMWHALSDEVMESDDCPELYVIGRGATIEEAFCNANLAAAHAKELSA